MSKKKLYVKKKFYQKKSEKFFYFVKTARSIFVKKQSQLFPYHIMGKITRTLQFRILGILPYLNFINLNYKAINLIIIVNLPFSSRSLSQYFSMVGKQALYKI